MPGLQRRLRSRHLQMIASVRGTIGTGLFIGSGSEISYGGPVGAMLAFVFVGTIFSWVTTFALELTATGLIIQYWENSIPIAIFIAVFWVLIVALNLLRVTFYGEIEFWLSSVKVLTIIGFMIFAICINAGVGAEGYFGFRYWVKPGPFNEYLIKDNPALARFVGLWAVMIKAGFAYGGTELIGMAVGEAENPRKAIPSAIRKVFYRIAFFFVFTVVFIGIIVPPNDHRLTASAEGGASGTNANASPLVLAAKRAGVKVLPSLINSVFLTVVLSAANSNVYTASRTLIG
ncbi:amino acid permease/ SLC12A domain-containing protein [Fusarium redolens]|uniref:Amino acid permease/ SLC12A domain-containing protein n=1 Tax=Fusarium redolens TaxID=48865 RepID=A0A9P9G583_FUSRE|nr:amino acid permease/ SLC12A domain-containing protein [Fusarium redolens]KAH7232247.1 amino acid permease/ SLC12A domain-containing protein [Fusarium redolens]